MTATAKQKSVSEEDLQCVKGMLGAALAYADLRHTTWDAQYRRDIQTLLDAIGQRDGIIHDMMQDGGVSRGVEQGRSEALEAIDTPGYYCSSCVRRIEANCGVKSLALPLPPDQARTEHQKCRLALEKIRLAFDDHPQVNGESPALWVESLVHDINETLKEAGA